MKSLYLIVSTCLMSGYCFPQTTVKPVIIDSTSVSVHSSKEVNISLPIPVKPGLGLYPNPAKNKVSLQVKGFEQGMATVKIIDMKGTPIREESRLLISGNEEVAMYFMLPPGVYFVLIRQKEKIARKKLAVN